MTLPSLRVSLSLLTSLRFGNHFLIKKISPSKTEGFTRPLRFWITISRTSKKSFRNCKKFQLALLLVRFQPSRWSSVSFGWTPTSSHNIPKIEWPTSSKSSPEHSEVESSISSRWEIPKTMKFCCIMFGRNLSRTSDFSSMNALESANYGERLTLTWHKTSGSNKVIQSHANGRARTTLTNTWTSSSKEWMRFLISDPSTMSFSDFLPKMSKKSTRSRVSSTGSEMVNLSTSVTVFQTRGFSLSRSMSQIFLRSRSRSVTSSGRRYSKKRTAHLLREWGSSRDGEDSWQKTQSKTSWD